MYPNYDNHVCYSEGDGTPSCSTPRQPTIYNQICINTMMSSALTGNVS